MSKEDAEDVIEEVLQGNGELEKAIIKVIEEAPSSLTPELRK